MKSEVYTARGVINSEIKYLEKKIKDAKAMIDRVNELINEQEEAAAATLLSNHLVGKSKIGLTISELDALHKLKIALDNH